MEPDSIIYSDDIQKSTTDVGSFDINLVLSFVALYCVICGIVSGIIAHYNGRSFMLGFVSGIFLGQLGVVAYMIMGEKQGLSQRKH